MLRVTSAVVALSLLPSSEAACPNGGLDQHGKCWYLGKDGASCSTTCAAQGLAYDHFVANEATPMVPQLLGRSPTHKQFSWGRIECYVQGADRYHTAKPNQDSSTGDNGQPGDWSQDVCRLACACTGGGGAAAAPQSYPSCQQSNVVLRHAGAHAIFVDLSAYGSAGCWQNDCKNTDKFNANNAGVCARACAGTQECTHWSFGTQDGSNKCFLRKSDGGREDLEAFTSGQKGCAPPSVPDSMQAQKAGEVLRACDAGKSDACPSLERAVSTWRYAIKALQRATEGKLDAGTTQYVAQIATDTEAFAAQLSEENYPIIAANNRQVFNALTSWMDGQTKVSVDANDMSLPAPMRGSLCGAKSCFGEEL